MKVLRNTLIVAALMVIGVIWVKSVLSQPPELPAAPQEQAVPAPVAQRQDAAPAPAKLAVPPMLAAAPSESPSDEEGVVHGEFTTDTDILKQKLFKKEPKLALFDYFRQHVLLDSNGREDYRKLLADKAMLEQTRDNLLHPTEAKDSMASNVKRLMQIDYLHEAMNWKEHPERENLLAEVERIILEDSFTAQMPLDIKRSISATKMELFELLYAQDANRAQALVEKARGTRLEKMLGYFAEYNQNRLAKEQALSLQAQKSSP